MGWGVVTRLQGKIMSAFPGLTGIAALRAKIIANRLLSVFREERKYCYPRGVKGGESS